MHERARCIWHMQLRARGVCYEINGGAGLDNAGQRQFSRLCIHEGIAIQRELAMVSSVQTDHNHYLKSSTKKGNAEKINYSSGAL